MKLTKILKNIETKRKLTNEGNFHKNKWTKAELLWGVSTMRGVKTYVRNSHVSMGSNCKLAVTNGNFTPLITEINPVVYCHALHNITINFEYLSANFQSNIHSLNFEHVRPESLLIALDSSFFFSTLNWYNSTTPMQTRA